MHSIISELRRRVAVMCRGCAKYVARMDYHDSVIKLVIQTHADVQRLHSCRKEPETVSWIEKEVDSDTVLYDIGANVGAYSLIAAARGAARVYAFEPGYSTFATLSENIIMNDMQNNITPFCLGIGNSTNCEELLFSDTASGSAQHSWGHTALRIKGQHITVPVMTLDDARENFRLSPPTMMKIDVDGLEFSVIQGAIHTIALPQLKTILIEIDEREQGTAILTRLLSDAGFVLSEKHPREKGKSTVLFNCIFRKTHRLP